MGWWGNSWSKAIAGAAVGAAALTLAQAAPRETTAPQQAIEAKVLDEINAARTNPARYADILRASAHGPAADEAVAFLRAQPPLLPLTADPRLAAAAAAHAADQGPRGLFAHVGTDGSTPRQRIQRAGLWTMLAAEEISLQQDTAAGVVRQLIIDASAPGRPHRADLFNANLRFAGVACGPNRQFRTMCVIDLAGTPMAGPGAEVAVVSRDGVAPVTASSTSGACPWPSGKLSVHMVDAEVYTALLYGTSDTFTNLADLLAQLKGKVAPHYDPAGICGRCIRQLDVWGHGDTGGGYISFGPDDAQIGNVAMGADFDQNLAGVAALMCADGKVVINQCNAGKGAKGVQALQALADKLGVPVSGPPEKIKGCRIFGGALTTYREFKPSTGVRTAAQNTSGPVSPSR